MKVLINGVEKDLIPYKGNPQQWWDGSDEKNILSFGELKFPTQTNNVTQTVSRVSVKTNVKCSVSKTPKPKSKASKKPKKSL